tara:strand:- start:1217 stop:1339 length:123 start_codon:yes stop_codon:yes gene_type:complete
MNTMDFILTAVAVVACIYLIKLLYVSELMIDDLKKESLDE